MLWPDSIELDGDAIALADVLADVVIHHGRTGVFDDPLPTTCQLTIDEVSHDFAREFRVGASLVVKVKDDGGASHPRFTGRITDATLDVDRLTAIAAGRLSTLWQYEIGAVAWPVETWSARVTRIFTEAGLPALLELYPDPQFNPPLAARDPETAGTTTLADYLAFLAPMIGAAVTDRADGRILVQAIGARTLAALYRLDPADVTYAPSWEQVLPLGNVITVRYTGDQSESVTVQDDASIALYGERPYTIDTAFVNAADATRRAQTRLARSAFSHWNIPEAPVLRGLELSLGQPVELSDMPPASPYDPWTPILEGWTDQITGPDWTMTLALSDPLASGLVLPWNAVPVGPGWAWNEINTETAWAEALTLDELIAR